MFEIDGHVYELKYTAKIVEQIENTANMSILAMLNDIPSIGRLKNMMGFALYNEHESRVSTKRGLDVAEALIEKYGLLKCFESVVERLSEDCAFLFQNA